MKRSILLWAMLVAVTLPTHAAMPAAEQLLPGDTLAVFTIPDWDKASSYFSRSPQGQLWQDPALKPFKDKFLKEFTDDIVAPLERQLGLKLADYQNLAHGQLTFAVTQNGWDGVSDKKPGWLLLLDAKDKREQLKTQLAGLKKKLSDGGRQFKSEKIRDLEFTTLVIQRKDLTQALEKAFSDKDANPPPNEIPATTKNEAPLEVSFGQSDSLLIVGNNVKDIERLLSRQSGGLAGTLAEQANFEASHSGLFRDALSFGWLNFVPIYESLNRRAKAAANSGNSANPLAPPSDKIYAAIGLASLKSVAFKFSTVPDGAFAEVFLGAPESGRQGIFKVLAIESKESAPPPFIPGDAVKFSRWRLDGQKAWAAVESMLSSLSPEMAGALQMAISMVGKDKDPNFDLKKSLIGNLGNDFISFERKPRAATLVELNSAPSLFLIGSPSAEQLTQALKTGASLLTMASPESTLKEREFLGRKVYSLPLPGAPAPDDAKAPKPTLNFAASGGYLALSGDVAMLEEYLRSSEYSGKRLREASGLAEAAQKIGGTSTGLFGFENHTETMRSTIEALRNDSARLKNILSMSGLGGKLGQPGEADLKDWFDFALLPSFDKIAKYFYFSVYSGSATREGLSWRIFAPTPPQLR